MTATALGRIDELRRLRIKMPQLRVCEEQLRSLSPADWIKFKGAMAAARRGTGALFDVMSEVRAYNYLAALGCSDIAFIAQAATPTPDLEGWMGQTRVLCEVKTIKLSPPRKAARHHTYVDATLTRLEPAFFTNKLAPTLARARRQLDAYATDARKIIYLVFNLETGLLEHREKYRSQIDTFLASSGQVEVVMAFEQGM